MNTKKTSFLLCSILPFSMCLADTSGADYQFNLSAIGVEKNNLNGSDNTLGPMLVMQYFLSPVSNDSQQAFDQHEFIQRKSNVYIGTVPSRVVTTSSKTLVNTHTVSGTYYAGDALFSLGYGQGSGQITSTDGSSNYYDLATQAGFYRLGYFVTPLSVLTLEVDQTKTTETAVASYLTDKSQQLTATSLNSRTLWSLSDGHSVSLELTGKHIKLVDTSTQINRDATVSLKYYPRPDMYAQWSFTRNEGDDKSTQGNTSVASASYAYSPRFSVMACYVDFSSSGTGLGLHSLLLGGNVRF
jgi:hypothetical protein